MVCNYKYIYEIATIKVIYLYFLSLRDRINNKYKSWTIKIYMYSFEFLIAFVIRKNANLRS